MEMRAQIYLQSLSQNQVCFLSISQTWQYIKDLTCSFAQANIKHINIFLKSTKGFQEPLWIAIPLNYASKIYLTELESQNLVKTISFLRFKKKKRQIVNTRSDQEGLKQTIKLCSVTTMTSKCQCIKNKKQCTFGCNNFFYTSLHN